MLAIRGILSSGTSYYSTIINNDPIWYVRLGDAGPSVVTDEIAGRNGVSAGGASFGAASIISGASNDAMAFTGSSYIGGIADNDIFSFVSGSTDQPFTIEAWIDLTDINLAGILGKTNNPSNVENEYLFFVDTNGKLAGALYKGTTADNHIVRSDNVVISVNTKYHVVWTTTGTTGQGLLYVNGAAVDVSYENNGTYTNMQNTDTQIRLGVMFLGGAIGFFEGRQDESALYDKVLTPTQILSHYNAGS